MKILLSLFFFILIPLLSAGSGNKHIIVAYDISKSMRNNPDCLFRINNYLIELLFKDIPNVSREDNLILNEESKFPLLEVGDRISFIKFGTSPIKNPEISLIYDESFDLRSFFKKLLPKQYDFIEDWTYIDLLYAKCGEIFLRHMELSLIRITVSDMEKSRMPTTPPEQEKIFWYRKNFSERCILNIQACKFFLDVVEVIPPKTGIDVIYPRPFEVYYKNKEILLKIRILDRGKPVFSKDWKVFAIFSHDKKEVKKPLKEQGGIYTGIIKVPSNSFSLSFFASDGEKRFRTDEMSFTLVEGKKNTFPYILSLITLILLLWYYLKKPYRVWIERMDFTPPRMISFKDKEDIIWLGERRNEKYVDLGLPSYSVVYQGKKLVLWKEEKEEGMSILLNQWLSPEDGISLRFSKKLIKKGYIEKEKEEVDFYKL